MNATRRLACEALYHLHLFAWDHNLWCKQGLTRTYHNAVMACRWYDR